MRTSSPATKIELCGTEKLNKIDWAPPFLVVVTIIVYLACTWCGGGWLHYSHCLSMLLLLPLTASRFSIHTFDRQSNPNGIKCMCPGITQLFTKGKLSVIINIYAHPRRRRQPFRLRILSLELLYFSNPIISSPPTHAFGSTAVVIIS